MSERRSSRANASASTCSACGLSARRRSSRRFATYGRLSSPSTMRAEPALLMPERPVQRLLLRAAGARVGEPAAQVHLPGHERDQRDRAGPGAGLDQLGQLLRLPAEELPVLHRERQPQHQLVQEQHDRVVAQALGVRRDRRQPGVEVDVAGLLGVRAEVVSRPARSPAAAAAPSPAAAARAAA